MYFGSILSEDFSMTRTWKGKIAVDSLLPGCCYYKKKFAYVSAS